MKESIRKATDATIPIKKTGDATAALGSAAKNCKPNTGRRCWPMPPWSRKTSPPTTRTASAWSSARPSSSKARRAMSPTIGLKPEDVTVKTTFLGGGFGRRLEYDFAVQAAEISKAVGKPVKLVWTREDDTTHDFYRPMALHRMAAASTPAAGWR
jgi:isoquinoline 1-oxidoreductase beta subunit